MLAFSRIRLSPMGALYASTLLLVGVCAIAMAQKLAPIPSQTVRVNDNASMLGENQEAVLDALLEDYEHTSGTKIVVLTVASTAPEQIEVYAARVAEAWQVGKANGPDILIVVARENRADLRRIRIEVGPAQQGVLTEALLRRIINEDILSRFRYLDYHGGLVAGVNRIKFLLAGGKMPPPVTVSQPAVVPPNPYRHVVAGVGAFLALCIVVFAFLRATARRMSYLAGNRALNRAFAPMIVGSIIARLPPSDDESNGFGGGFVGPGIGGYAGGGGDFSGGGATGDW